MDILNEEILLNEKDLLITIWTKPKLTLKFIFKYCPQKYVTALLILNGITNSLDRNNWLLTNQKPISTAFLIGVLIFGVISGPLLGKAYAASLEWTGNWLKGKAKTDQFLTVIAWSTVPYICSLVLLIPKLLVFDNEFFTINMNDLANPKTIDYLGILFFGLALSIWGLVILVKGIALIQKFSNMKALLNAVLPVLVLLVPITMILGIIYLLS